MLHGKSMGGPLPSARAGAPRALVALVQLLARAHVAHMAAARSCFIPRADPHFIGKSRIRENPCVFCATRHPTCAALVV